jgi:hypothetical protein
MSSALVLACYHWQLPRKIRFPSDPGLPGHLGGLAEIIGGGPIESVPLDGGVYLWCSVGALQPGPGRTLNRRVPRDPELPPGFKDFDTARRAVLMAASAHYEVHGDFLLARGDAVAGLEDMTDEDVERWTIWFEVDDHVRRRAGRGG